MYHRHARVVGVDVSAKILQFAGNGLSGVIAGRSAASNVDVKVAGLKELVAALSGLPIEIEKRAVYAALGGAARIVRDAAIANAPEISDSDPKVTAGTRKKGTIKRAIRASRSKINKGQKGLYEMIVRVKPLKARARKAFKQTTGKMGKDNPEDPFYWWWVEFGTSKMSARPFLRPAFTSTKEAQLVAIRKRMAASIAAYARKMAGGRRAA